MSARDYDRFLHMLVNEGQLDGARILKPATARLAALPPGNYPLSLAGDGAPSKPAFLQVSAGR